MNLWLCIDLPCLSLEALGTPLNCSRPRVVSVQHTVHLADTAAQDLGIRPGMKISAAMAFGDIEVIARSLLKEQEAITGLCVWCGQFTSRISIESPSAVVLEIGGSLVLFKGFALLYQEIVEGLKSLSYTAVIAVAPTPTAALWLARAGVTTPVFKQCELPDVLDKLSLRVLDLKDRHLLLLRSVGVSTIGECRNLPRAGLIRRLGSQPGERLDYAYGVRQEVRQCFEPPAQFQRRIDLTAETSNTEALLFVARRLLLELVGFLKSRAVGVQVLSWQLIHRDGSATAVSLGLLAPACDEPRFSLLFRERLERLSLSAPVQALALTTGELLPLQNQTVDLFKDAKATHAGDSNVFIERLRARLGTAAVQGLMAVAEHRPEYAWRYCEPGSHSESSGVGARPLWLLQSPIILDFDSTIPTAFENPEWPLVERIQTGWWDACGVNRDYYIVRRKDGIRLWLYQDRSRPGKWYVHGLFV